MKYSFLDHGIDLFSSEEMISFLQKDYEYLQTFLSTNIADQQLVTLLVKSPAMQQILMIINLLQTGGKNGSISSRMKNRRLASDYSNLFFFFSFSTSQSREMASLEKIFIALLRVFSIRMLLSTPESSDYRYYLTRRMAGVFVLTVIYFY